MHRMNFRTYVGAPNETAFLSTTLAGGGQVTKTLNGVPLLSDQFSLGPAGQQQRLQIVLAGPLDASCVVGISEVDGGTDGDLLLCQPHDPAPVQFYEFSVVPAAAVRGLGMVRSAAAPRAARPEAAKPAARKKPAKKGPSRKKAARKQTRQSAKGKQGGRK